MGSHRSRSRSSVTVEIARQRLSPTTRAQTRTARHPRLLHSVADSPDHFSDRCCRACHSAPCALVLRIKQRKAPMMSQRPVKKRAVDLFVDADPLDEARRMRINVSETLKRRPRTIVPAEREKRWLEQN